MPAAETSKTVYASYAARFAAAAALTGMLTTACTSDGPDNDAGDAAQASDGGPVPTCGDGVCDTTESCALCEADCGSCEECPPTRFAVIGDYGMDNAAEAAVAALVKSWNVDFIVTVGDNNYPDGEAATIDQNVGKHYQEYIGNYQGVYGPGSPRNRFWPTPGNHDWHAPDLQPYLDYFVLPGNERYYSVELDAVHLFALDSDTNEPDGVSSDSVQADWLRTELAASTACWKLVAFHHAPYSSSLHGPTTYMRWPFESWGADAVFSGHDHVYERLQVGSIPYFVNGAGGAALYNFFFVSPSSVTRYNQSHGAMQVEADACGRIEYRFYSVDGMLRDALALTKSCP